MTGVRCSIGANQRGASLCGLTKCGAKRLERLTG